MAQRRMPEKGDLPSNNPRKPDKKEEKSTEVSEEGKTYDISHRKPNVIEKEAGEVKDFVVNDIVIPTAKDMLFNTVEGVLTILRDAVENAIFGRSSGGGLRTKRGSHIPYNSIYNNRRTASTSSSRFDRRERASFDDYRTVIFRNRYEAEEVREKLYNILEENGEVTVGDINRELRLPTEYTDEDWGWYSLETSRIKPARGGGYILDMPREKALGR